MRRLAFSLIVSALFGAALSAAGCSPTSITLDGGSSDGTLPPSGTLTILGEPSLQLTTGETVTVRARYEEEGPIANRVVRFALVGQADDAALGALMLTTDANGEVETTFTASNSTTAFRLRASSERASAVYLNVSVGTEGFGTLVVDATYDGRRTESPRRILRIFSDVDCDAEGGLPASADRTITLEDADTSSPRWSLPIGIPYAATAEVLSEEDTVLAAGCVDGIELSGENDTSVTVPLTDAPLRPEGRYDAVLELFSGESAAAALEPALDRTVGGLDGDGSKLFIETLEAQLRRRGEISAADELARLQATTATELSAAFAADDSSPLAWLERLQVELERWLSVIRLGGSLTVALADDMSLGGTWMASRLELGPSGGPGALPPEVVDIEELGSELLPRLTLDWRSAVDLIDLDLAMTLRLSDLLVALLERWLEATEWPHEDTESSPECQTLRSFVAASSELSAACDEACANEVCSASLVELGSALRDSIQAQAAPRDRVAVSGSVTTPDADQDLEVDRLEGRGLTGSWRIGETSDERDAITADFVARRLTE